MTLEELCKRLEELTRECDRIALEIVQKRKCAFCADGWAIQQTSDGPVHIDVIGNHKDYGNSFACPTAELPAYLIEEREA